MNLSDEKEHYIKVISMNLAKRITYYGSCRVGVSSESFWLKLLNLDIQLIRGADFVQLFVLRQKYLLVAHQQVVLIFPSVDLCNTVVENIKKLKNVAVAPGLENDFKAYLLVPLLSEIHHRHPQAEEMKKEVLIYVNGIPDADIRREYTIMGFQILMIGVASVVQSEPAKVVDDHDPRTALMEQESAVTPTNPVAIPNAASLQPMQQAIANFEPAYEAQEGYTSSSHVDADSSVAEEDAVDTSTSSIAVFEKRKPGRPRKENGGVAAKSKEPLRASTRHGARLASSLPVRTSSTPSSSTIPTNTGKKGPGRPRKQ